jgi:hypothetical protein
MSEGAAISDNLVLEFNVRVQSASRWGQVGMQCRLLLQELFRQKIRDWPYFAGTTTYFLVTALLISFVYFQVPSGTIEGDTAAFQALYYIRTLITVLSVQTVVNIFDNDRHTILAPHVYVHRISPTLVFYCRLLITMPFRWLMTTICSFIFYPIIGLRNGANYFLVFLLTQLVQELAAVTSGMLISAACTDPVVASTAGTMLLSFNSVFGGFSYNRNLVPWEVRWMEFLSLTYYSGVALSQNQLNGTPGEALLVIRDLTLLSEWAAIGCLALLCVLNVVLGPLVLHWSTAWLHRKHRIREKQRIHL